MDGIWKKCHCTMCVKLALKANIKGHIFLKMKWLRLPNFWSLCIAMCVDPWRPHFKVEHDTFSSSSMIFHETFMFIFWKWKKRCLTNSRHRRPWWKLKSTWKSKPCNSTIEENLCPKSLMIFCVIMESNDKQVHLTHYNKMELGNKPIRPSWSVLKDDLCIRTWLRVLGRNDIHGGLHEESMPN
jgi:hypothetical protein